MPGEIRAIIEEMEERGSGRNPFTENWIIEWAEARGIDEGDLLGTINENIEGDLAFAALMGISRRQALSAACLTMFMAGYELAVQQKAGKDPRGEMTAIEVLERVASTPHLPPIVDDTRRQCELLHNMAVEGLGVVKRGPSA